MLFVGVLLFFCAGCDSLFSEEKMEILYEDPSLLVCIKPVGVLSQQGGAGKDMISLLSEHTGGTVYPVHRLDKEVGGVMVYAKNAKSASDLCAQIAAHTFQKEYLAALHGTVREESAVLEDLLFKDSSKNKTYVVKRMRKGVREAKLSYQRLCTAEKDGETYTLVRVRLYTGRSHQIRVQFASRKHPLFADAKYGAKGDKGNIALWSYRLSFLHPETQESLAFSALPQGDGMLNYLLNIHK